MGKLLWIGMLIFILVGSVNIFAVADTNPPQISNATLSPEVIKPGDVLTVSATITDDVNLRQVFVYVFRNPNTLVSVALVGYGIENVNYVVPTADLVSGSYRVIIGAYDLAGNSGWATLSFTVDTPPEISGATLSPEVIKPGDLLTLNAVITDDVELRQVFVYVFCNDPNSFVSSAFIGSGIGNVNYVVPTADLIWSSYRVILGAYDSRGQSSWATLYFTVDSTPPLVTITHPLAGEVYSEAITTAGYAVDNVTDSSDLIIDVAVSPKFDVNDGTGSFDVQALHPNNITIRVTAMDEAGNVGESSVDVIRKHDRGNHLGQDK